MVFLRFSRLDACSFVSIKKKKMRKKILMLTPMVKSLVQSVRQMCGLQMTFHNEICIRDLSSDPVITASLVSLVSRLGFHHHQDNK